MVSDAKADPDARQALHLLIDGRVQGVGYRYALAAEAQAIGLCGWVRNLTDGRVEVFAQGPRDALDKLVAWAQRGPALARVTSVTPQPVALDPSLRAFEIAPTARCSAYP